MRRRLSSLSKILRLLSLALILLAHLPLQTLGFRVSASVKGEHRKLGQNNQPSVYDLEKSMKTEKAAFIRLASVAPRLTQTRAALSAPSLIGINPSRPVHVCHRATHQPLAPTQCLPSYNFSAKGASYSAECLLISPIKRRQSEVTFECPRVNSIRLYEWSEVQILRPSLQKTCFRNWHLAN